MVWEVIFLCGQNTQSAISRGFSRGPRLFGAQIVLSAAKGKITSQTIRISGALCPKNFRFIVYYSFLIVLKCFEIAENAPKLLNKCAKM
jgi:hypothetical protein